MFVHLTNYLDVWGKFFFGGGTPTSGGLHLLSPLTPPPPSISPYFCLALIDTKYQKQTFLRIRREGAMCGVSTSFSQIDVVVLKKSLVI